MTYRIYETVTGDRAETASQLSSPRATCWPCVLALLLMLSGCGSPRGVTGGTMGILHAGAERLAEIQITVHQVDGAASKPIGFAATRLDGTFELVTNGAQGPLRLRAGDYRCTLESIGSPLPIPPEFTRPETTPLKVSWTDTENSLDLNVPALIPGSTTTPQN